MFIQLGIWLVIYSVLGSIVYVINSYTVRYTREIKGDIVRCVG